MKKLLLFSMIALVGITASAAEITKEQFIAKEKATAENSGKEFDEAKAEAAFSRKDRNSDGVLSDAEQAPAKSAAPAKKGKNKKK